MVQVQFPEPDFMTKKEGTTDFIFCIIRKQWLQLTEEEWVRQNFVAYLIKIKKYPATLIALEKELELNGLKKRFDILVYDAFFKPWLLVECKAPHIALSDLVLQQALRYNVSLPVSYIVITNGNHTLGWKKEKSLESLKELPDWKPDQPKNLKT